MFTTKKTSLFTTSNSSKAKSTLNTPSNPFLKAGHRQSVTTTSLGNGAVKLTTTGSDFVDQFASATNYRKPRTYQDISKDMLSIWGQDKNLALRLSFYLRMITRKTSLFDGTKTETSQRGQGLKHEGVFRMIWIAVNHPEDFWNNAHLLVTVGSWQDIFTMLSYDLQWNGWEGRVLDWKKMGEFLLAGLENENTNQLLLKYLPAIKANSKCKTLEAQADNIIAKWLCSLIFGEKNKGNTYVSYRKMKSSGTAHSWQQLISQNKMFQIDFNTIHGRALSKMVSGKFLKNNRLESKFTTWIESKPVAKYTGYVYELLAPVKNGYKNKQLSAYQSTTINKQFYGLIETGKDGMVEGENGFIVVVDSSSSMTGKVAGTKVSAYDVAKSMALYFSHLLEGKFKGAFMEFANTCEMRFWKGNTPVEQLQNDRCEAYGSTHFQGVATTFGRYLKQGVPESEFPKGIICVSDGCFNSTSTNKSNFRTLKDNLLEAGFSSEYVENFKVVLWDIPNNYYYGGQQKAFEEFADYPNLYHISGLDGSAIAFVTGTTKQTSTPKNSDELFLAAMDQEVLDLVEV